MIKWITSGIYGAITALQEWFLLFLLLLALADASRDETQRALDAALEEGAE